MRNNFSFQSDWQDGHLLSNLVKSLGESTPPLTGSNSENIQKGKQSTCCIFNSLFAVICSTDSLDRFVRKFVSYLSLVVVFPENHLDSSLPKLIKTIWLKYCQNHIKLIKDCNYFVNWFLKQRKAPVNQFMPYKFWKKVTKEQENEIWCFKVMYLRTS